MSKELDTRARVAILLRAAGIMLPILLTGMAILLAWTGQTEDLFLIGALLLVCALGWLIYAVFHLARTERTEGEEDWPTGQL